MYNGQDRLAQHLQLQEHIISNLLTILPTISLASQILILMILVQF